MQGWNGFHKLHAMKNLQRNIVGLIVLAAIAIVAYTIGKSMGRKDTDTRLINNYSFVKNIIELAGLQVSGTTTFKSTNTDSSGGFWSGIKNVFAENTAVVTIPYTAKYGVALKESDLYIERKDSIVHIAVPATQLLSLELHMDRLETTSKKGLLIMEDDEYFNSFQKKLYSDTRQTLEGNKTYLQQSQQRISSILQQYYQPLGLKVEVAFK
jgi:uncharacterized protein (UPF0333 family)